MVVYSVEWIRDTKLAKGKGRVPDKQICFRFSVLCRSSKDAVTCLEWVFRNEYPNSRDLSLDDGQITLYRCIVDSRNFNPTYLFCDGVKQPITLSNVKNSLDKLLLHYRPY